MMDDTLSHNQQGREDVLLASIEAGILPGLVHRPLEEMPDVDALYAECRALGYRGVYVCRVSRVNAEQGLAAGAAYGLLIANMPENVRGRVLLSFDGWADDPRGLWEVPEVIAFCNGLIYGHDPNPGRPAMAQAVLPYLIDEASLTKTMGRQAWDVAGRYWVLSVAYAPVVYEGHMRDVSLAMNLFDVFMGM